MTITQAAPWWRTAPNPPCVSWCEDTHGPGEFAQGGGMICRKTIADDPDFSVEVQSYAGTDEHETPGVYDYSTSVWIDVKALRYEGTLSPEQARSLTLALMLATSEAATVAERTVRA